MTFSTMSIRNFRGVRALRLSGLSRVNLLVGANNSGKTTVLDAVHALASGGDLGTLLAGLRRRDERSFGVGDERLGGSGLDARHLFHGRTIDGEPIQLRATTDDGRETALSVTAPQVIPEDKERFDHWLRGSEFAMARRARFSPRFVADLDDPNVERDPTRRLLEVTRGGVVTGRAVLTGGSTVFDDDAMLSPTAPAGPIHFVSTRSLTQPQLARILDRAVETDDLPAAIAALNTVEQGITRIAAVGDGAGRRIVVGLKGDTTAVPLGSMGDGMARMLALALSASAARGGFLLVDEIDTGLHHTVMQAMWRMVAETARRLNVVVFATTHSYDCVHALSAITDGDSGRPAEVALLRVEREIKEAIHFSAGEIAKLAEWGIEPR